VLQLPQRLGFDLPDPFASRTVQRAGLAAMNVLLLVGLFR
jgi:hypothetical protein